ncbi:DNA-directed RNA polymerase [Striga asiatica]|uniref:DNA-directed RNA polymerase subunit n=1 Tax=Striga asiatica TaxID=4170 RepID=A0A5A7QWH8_STRAF|nr:DNA-directed RNA polymerase [Striga asiatica]
MNFETVFMGPGWICLISPPLSAFAPLRNPLGVFTSSFFPEVDSVLQGTTEVVRAVRFGFMSNEEVRRQSSVKITNPNLLDALDNPIPGGLYDPAMGPLDDLSPCKLCGQRSYHCGGHCGHVDLVSLSYNPLLFRTLSKLLKNTCLYCFKFRLNRSEVAKCVSRLELIGKGDIIRAREVGLEKAVSLVNVTETKESKQTSWDSCLLTEAIGVLNELKRPKDCKNCGREGPKIRTPTFGWFHVEDTSFTELRGIVIQSRGSDLSHSGRGEGTPSSEVLDADCSWKDDSEIMEAHSIDNKVVNQENNSNHGLIDTSSLPLLPTEVRDILRRLWENEAPLCSYLYDIQHREDKISGNATGYSMFFLENVLVPPIKFRPPAIAGHSVMEHPHTVLLGKVLQSNIALRDSQLHNSERPRIIACWVDLQQSINVLFDSKTATSEPISEDCQAQIKNSGICQYLEHKEGLFRQNMMGKRVNFSCRSVISPDPYLSVNEIGVPPCFALRLTYPERVTPWNAGKLRAAVINGPEIHPGATTYVDSMTTVKLPQSTKMRVAISRKLPSSRGSITESGNELDFESKIVYRHLQDGDIVLVNRQPTLHKPSIMAHVVRVLEGEKTLRMHYANCSSYNADFDGDEINVHFPQDEISRAEAYSIVNANEQYIVPTRGEPVRALIQDHIVAAVLLTMKDTFLSWSDFSQLLCGSGVFAAGPGSRQVIHSSKFSRVDCEGLVESVLPAVWKPVPLWTGKQVVTALLNHITQGCAPCITKNQGKVPKTYFTGTSFQNDEDEEDQNAEHELLVWKNELVRGVIDKDQFGKFGLVHTVQELYGSDSAGILLSALSRLLTIFLQMNGFTCGVDDLVILPHYDLQRKEKLEGEDVGEEVHCEFVNFKSGQIGPEELQMEIEKAICSDRESATASLDMKMKNKLTSRLTKEGSEMFKQLLTVGLLKPFPKNCISVMTTAGAKGSTVNFQQISAYLGQQELEGKRVPRMVSGKTLPSFPPWDFSSRAGGFISSCFLSGLRPQEYYFHCMAGREGLIDTAVKTSRSGYLQRCLIKNLESLKVCYDFIVRDSDGSIIQFYYGDDGVDVHWTSFLKNFKALQDNEETYTQKFQNQREFNSYITKLPEGLEEEARRFIHEASEKPNAAEYHLHKKRRVSKSSRKAFSREQDKFLELVKQKYLSSLAQPGESVGIIAAQSVGEPSTQMTGLLEFETLFLIKLAVVNVRENELKQILKVIGMYMNWLLNTFHLAGRGEMNVTLGIPRLQEILRTASRVIKTPILTCPLSELRSKHDVISLVSKVKKVTVADLAETMEVALSIEPCQVARVYKLKMRLKDTELISLEDTHDTLRTAFLLEMEIAIHRHIKLLTRVNRIEVREDKVCSSRSEASGEAGDDNADGSYDDADDDHDTGDDLGLDSQKRKQQARDEFFYDDGMHDEHDSDNGECENSDDRNETRDAQSVDEVTSEAESSHRKGEAATTSGSCYLKVRGLSNSIKPKSVYMYVEGLSFEVHFRFTTEPHLLLAQIAQAAAKKVCIKKRTADLGNCKMVQYDPEEKTVIWDDEKKSPPHDVYWAVKASGVDLSSLWTQMDGWDYLDLTRLYSNNIHAMLDNYGVEAARATLIREVTQVFEMYGVKVDYRHLSLIADYMTHTGGILAMNRSSISQSMSPFLKMTFETASKFVVQAASNGLMDELESASSRICLGLPVKMGTGCFDLINAL